MTYWYIHPVNKVTNDEVMRRLSDEGRGSGENNYVARLAKDGKEYPVIEVKYRLLRELYHATTKRGGDFQFLPFKAEKTTGEMDFVPEFLLTRSRQAKKIQAAQAFIDKQAGKKISV